MVACNLDSGLRLPGDANPDSEVDSDDSRDAPPCVPPPVNLVSWWAGEDAPTDIVGSNEATQTGGVSFVDGKVGRAFQLDGSTQFVRAADDPSLDFTQQITIEAWVRLDIATPAARIVNKASNGIGDGYLLDVASGRLRFFTTGTSTQAITDFPVGALIHVAGVNDGTNVHVYVDGIEADVQPVVSPISANALPLTIGAAQDGDLTWPGAIDEVSIYGRGLSATEVQTIFAAGSNGKCKP